MAGGQEAVSKSAGSPVSSKKQVPIGSGQATLDDLLDVVARLRDPDGCPWDRVQTYSSLRPYLLEETYELLEAIDSDDSSAIAEELGDLLVHIAFHTDMARRDGAFTAGDVIEGAHAKLLRRHPHVFGDGEKLSSPQEVVERWEDFKREERGGGGSISESVPTAMPALAYAAGIQHRAEQAGIAWRDAVPAPVFSGESRSLLKAAPEGDERDREAGQLLFSLVAELRDAGLDPEAALRAAGREFRDRLRRTESLAGESPLSDLAESDRNRIWAEAESTD